MLTPGVWMFSNGMRAPGSSAASTVNVPPLDRFALALLEFDELLLPDEEHALISNATAAHTAIGTFAALIVLLEINSAAPIERPLQRSR